MNPLDILVIAIIIFFAFLGYVRGGVKQVFVILKWVGAFGLTKLVASYLIKTALFVSIEPLWWRYLLAYGGFFVLCFEGFVFLGYGLTRVINSLGLEPLNRLLGIAGGSIKGVLIIMLSVLLLNHTPIKYSQLWQTSFLLPYVEQLTHSLASYVIFFKSLTLK